MQSLFHDSAHFVIDGRPVCADAANGAKSAAWLPHDGCVRKCPRCMKHAGNTECTNPEGCQ